MAAAAVLDEFEPDVVFALNGLFASERVVRELALARGMRVATYEMGPRSDTLFFSTDAPACDYDTTGVWERGARAPADRRRSARAIEKMLAERVAGRGAHESYFDRSVDDGDALRAELGPPARAAGALAVHQHLLGLGRAGARRRLRVDDRVDRRARRGWPTSVADADLVVRIHPAEARWGTNEDVEAAVRERLGRRPGQRADRAGRPGAELLRAAGHLRPGAGVHDHGRSRGGEPRRPRGGGGRDPLPRPRLHL